MKKNRNAGVTLVEVIVVIAIMGILVGMSSVGISLMFGHDAEKTAVDIEGGLDKLRSYSMSKSGNWYIEIRDDGSRSQWTIYQDGVPVEEKDLGVKADLNPDLIDIRFDRVSGGVSGVSYDGSVWSTPPTEEVIRITAGSRRTGKKKTVNIVRLTGRHFVD